MNSDQITNLCELTAYLAHRAGLRPLSAVAKDAQAIHKDARRLTQLAENDCNRGLDAAEDKEVTRREKRIAELLTQYGLTANFSGDPRGYVVKIVGLPGNTWGGDSEGFGVG